MSGADTIAFRYKQFLLSLPGKRGIDVPEDVFDRIHPVASGITQQLWGRAPTPHQMQWLFDSGRHSPQQVHEAFSNLPHPHAPSLKVGEFSAWQAAHKMMQQHGR